MSKKLFLVLKKKLKHQLKIGMLFLENNLTKEKYDKNYHK